MAGSVPKPNDPWSPDWNLWYKQNQNHPDVRFRSVGAAGNASKRLTPKDINFSQRTVSGNVDNYVKDMKAGNWDWNQSGPIRIMEQDGKWVSYDNRRLMAAQQAGLKDIPYEVVDPKAIMPGSKKTWEQAFKKRFNDRRNVQAGGAVPVGGLSGQPEVIR